MPVAPLCAGPGPASTGQHQEGYPSMSQCHVRIAVRVVSDDIRHG